MRYVVVMPWMHRGFRDECLAGCRLDNLLEIDNSEHNRGCTRSYNLGIDAMRAQDADWLIVLSPAIRFGADGGLDFIRALERCDGHAVVNAEGVFGWHFIAFARSTIDAAGRWDENFHPCYWDDIDYSIRIHKAVPDGIWSGIKALSITDTIMAHSIKLAGLKIPNQQLIEYFTAKWTLFTGHDFHEYPDHPWNDPSLPIGYWPATRGATWDSPAPAES